MKRLLDRVIFWRVLIGSCGSDVFDFPRRRARSTIFSVLFDCEALVSNPGSLLPLIPTSWAALPRAGARVTTNFRRVSQPFHHPSQTHVLSHPCSVGRPRSCLSPPALSFLLLRSPKAADPASCVTYRRPRPCTQPLSSTSTLYAHFTVLPLFQSRFLTSVLDAFAICCRLHFRPSDGARATGTHTYPTHACAAWMRARGHGSRERDIQVTAASAHVGEDGPLRIQNSWDGGPHVDSGFA